MRHARTLKLTALVAVFTVLLAGTALADIVTNDVSNSADGGVLSVQAGSSATVKYGVQNTNRNNSTDPQSSCNPADGSSLTISVTGLPQGVTAGSLVVSQCADNVGQITFQVGSAVTPGDYAVGHTFTDSGTGTYTNHANFTLRVTPPPDSTPPSITPTVTGTLGDNGWYTSNVDLSWSVVDNESAISSSSGCGTTTITADQAATDYTCTATSAGGTSSKTVSIKRDATAPQVAYTSASGTEGSNGWYTSDVVATFTATDLGSGFASGSTKTATAATSGEGLAVTVGSPAFTDLAGNTAAAGTATSPGFKVDKSAPNPPSVSLSAGANGNGWHNSPVIVSFTANGDNGPSGVASCSDAVTVSEDTAAKLVEGTCIDHAGNVSAKAGETVKLDQVAPQVQYTSASGDAGTNGWYTSDVTATFMAADALSGFGSGASTTGTAKTSGEGSAVAVGSPAFTDLAGNTVAAGAATSPGFKIDKTAPSNIQFSGVDDSYYYGSAPANPQCTADDAVSGLASCTVTGGGTAVGTHTLTATAIDNAGNQATATTQYTVLAWTLKGFYSPVDGGGVYNTVKNGSTVPLKFEVFAGATELTDTAIVKFTAKQVNCTSGALEDLIELTTTGGTSLRYDTTAGQFVQNWQTPKKAGTCYEVTMTTSDGSLISALFKLK